MKEKNISNDPYRWLEKDSKKVNTWINKQGEITSKYFSSANKIKELKKKLNKLYKKDTSFLPNICKNKYYFRIRKSNEDQPSIYVKSGLRGKPKLLLNINKLSSKYGSLYEWKVSKDEKYLSLQFSKSSNDKCDVRIFDIKNNKFLEDYIPSNHYPYFNAFNIDSTGFWYSRGESNSKSGDEKYNKKIYYHKIGESINKDKLFFGQDLTKEDWPTLNTSYDGRYLFIHIHQKDNNTKIYFADSTKNEICFINLTKNIDAKSYAKTDGQYIYLKTDYKAPNGKILRKKISDIKLKNNWEIYIKETQNNIEEWCLTRKYIFLEYLVNVNSQLYYFDLKTKKQKEIILPCLGSINAYSSEFNSEVLFFSYVSFNLPTTHYVLDLNSLKYKIYWKSKKIINTDNFVVKQEWSISKDGTNIPMFIVHKKGLNQNSLNPTLVYAYGGFNSSLTPHFSPSLVPFLEDGGIYVSANIRGGNEFGDRWNKSVILKKRHKCFEDFASVLEHMTKRKYTNPNKIAIWGGSNGGLLMSVIMLRYPDLFKTAIISVPVTDMLRYHLFNGGRWWMSEYGDPDNKVMRKYLLSYSPYHNVGNLNYPSALFMTSDHDDRVHPMHSYKMVARLQENKNQKNPIILDIQKNSGHSGSGKISSQIDKMSRMFAFLYKELDMDRS